MGSLFPCLSPDHPSHLSFPVILSTSPSLHFLICKNGHDGEYLRIKQDSVGKARSLKENKFSILVANIINLLSSDSTGR